MAQIFDKSEVTKLSKKLYHEDSKLNFLQTLCLMLVVALYPQNLGLGFLYSLEKAFGVEVNSDMFIGESGFQRAVLFVILFGVVGVGNYAISNYAFEVFWYGWHPWNPNGYRKDVQKWKIQPRKTIKKEEYFLAVRLSCLNMLLGGIGVGLMIVGQVTGYFPTKIYNTSPLEYMFASYGYNSEKLGFAGKILDALWITWETVLYFWTTEFVVYLYHRAVHLPIFYKYIHKTHHHWTAPFPFVAVAVNPVEFIINDIINFGLIYLVPMHFLAVALNAYYSSVEGLLSHTGVHVPTLWPWQPPSTFHDDHHSLFHVNFGLRSSKFDEWFGTLRRGKKSNVEEYGEDHFFPQILKKDE